MNVKEAIEARRAYRALGPVAISDADVAELAKAAQLAPSCFNNQPWRFVFVREPGQLEKVREALSKGNEWAHKASMFVAVFAKKEEDCMIKEREYYLFDTGLATAQLILRATEMGLVAHPIAGYSPKRVSEALAIPDGYMVIALLIVGRHAAGTEGLSEKQAESEPVRPERLPIEKIAHHDRFSA